MNSAADPQNQGAMDYEARKVLIADDDPTTRKLLERILEKNGFSPIGVGDGNTVIEQLSGEICAVVLDISMPGMNGLECLDYIKRNYPDLSPIMLTASDAVSDAVYAMKQGAFDYIVKPFHTQQISSLVEHAARSFEQTLRLREAEESLRQARQNEISVASRIQQSLLIGRPPEDFPGLRIAHMTIPSQEIDGDFYDFIRLDPDTMDLVVADVMGKGIRAAFLGAALKSYFLRVVSETRLSTPGVSVIEPEEIVDAVYSHMITRLVELESFVTLFYARFYPKKKLFTYVDCGHVRPAQFHHSTGEVSLLKGANMPLGFPEQNPFSQFCVSFAANDVFLFYSDGLTETRSPEGEQFGEDRLVACVKRHAGDSAETLIQALKSEVVDFSGQTSFADDFTCVAVKVDDQTVPSELLGHQELHADSSLTELYRIRRFVRAFSKKYMRRASDDERISGIELAAAELATNIIQHGYGGQSGSSIRIEAVACRGEISFAFYDRGGPFDPNFRKAPVLDGSREGGMGMYIIEQSVDEFTYSRNPDGENCNRLVVCWS
ncbi:MAG: SpoIIE family protein phosphatase [Desulfosalsimonadaceae bacterium]